MSLRSMAAVDNNKILNQDGDYVKLTAPDSTVYNVKGQVIRIDAIIDPQTNVQIYEPRTAVTVSLSDLSTEPTTGWEIETTDVTGAIISGQVSDVRFDRTLNFVTLILEEVE